MEPDLQQRVRDLEVVVASLLKDVQALIEALKAQRSIVNVPYVISAKEQNYPSAYPYWNTGGGGSGSIGTTLTSSTDWA